MGKTLQRVPFHCSARPCEVVCPETPTAMHDAAEGHETLISSAGTLLAGVGAGLAAVPGQAMERANASPAIAPTKTGGLFVSPPSRAAVLWSSSSLRACRTSPFRNESLALLRRYPRRKRLRWAGGGALITRGDVERSTRDIDFFAVGPEEVNRLVPALRSLRESGLEVRRIQSGSSFPHLEVADGEERTVVGLAADAQLFRPKSVRLGQF